MSSDESSIGVDGAVEKRLRGLARSTGKAILAEWKKAVYVSPPALRWSLFVAANKV